MDMVVVVIYLLAVFLVAYFARRKEIAHFKTAEEIPSGQYLSGRDLTFIESIGSIIATEVSALTFLGIPAFAYTKDFSFLQIYIGAIAGRFIIARVLFKYYYNQSMTLYEAMARNGKDGQTIDQATKNGARTMASIYTISKILAVGVRLYSGSILVATFFNMSIYWAIFLSAAATFLYTLYGGLKAVVRTDLLQTCVFVGGGLYAHYLIPQLAGVPWSNMIAEGVAQGKATIFPANIAMILAGVIGGMIFDLATHGVDQDFAQRLMACKDLKTGQRSIFYSSFASIAVATIFLSLGILLFIWNARQPFPIEIKPDYLFAHVITTYFSPAIQGLMLAAVLAATMSTLDSTINAISAVLWNDIFPNRPLARIKTYIFGDNLIITLALIIVAFLATFFDGLLILGLKIASWSGGALLGLMLWRFLLPKWNRVHFHTLTVLACYAANLIIVALNTFVLQFDWQWNVPLGALAALAYLGLAHHFNRAN